MDLKSCSNCGIVIDRNRVEFIETYPDEGKDEDDYYGEMNPDIIWICKEPCNTWKCPVCETFNGVEE
ncbi:MAG: hypothetical protein DRJ10_08315 [Bacteroidetes bacterium]|nr:MAG: hypothetical protein DRJ10_08315 [Bacteroidota bacterium]